MIPTRVVRFALKPAVFAAALTPFVLLAVGAATAGLGPNPVEEVTHRTGDWTLRFLLLTLAVTPLRRVTGWNDLGRFRRMLGLFAFFYGSLHLLTYVWLDKFFAWDEILHDIPKRPFVTAGFLAFVVMVPLAATSTAGMIRRLGGKAWQRLHRLVYVAAAAGVVHYWWLVKADITRPRRYAAVLAVLLVARALVAYQRRSARATSPTLRRASPSAS